MLPLRIIDLETVAYAVAEQAQQKAAEQVFHGADAALFILEHPPVITFGRNGGQEHLPFSPDFFAERGVALVHSSRGGSITCHFPGQLVAYPVMRINGRPGGLRGFFHDMEEAVIRTLAHFGLKADRVEGRPGVWVNEQKICSTGIALKHWITRHGLSVNVAADLSLFELVTPCGLPGVKATSLHREMGSDCVPMEKVKATLVKEFCSVFHMAPVNHLTVDLSDAGK